MTDAELTSLAQRATNAVDALFARMKEVDRRDPRFMSTMRKYGLIQLVQETLNAGADVTTALSHALKEKSATAAPATVQDRAAAAMARVNRDRVIMARQRANGSMTEADYAAAMRELDSIAAQAAEWTG